MINAVYENMADVSTTLYYAYLIWVTSLTLRIEGCPLHLHTIMRQCWVEVRTHVFAVIQNKQTNSLFHFLFFHQPVHPCIAVFLCVIE